MMNTKPIAFFDKGIFCRSFRVFAKALAAAFFICAVMSMTVFDARAQRLSDDVVRLHILANSDSAEDQALKLKVRDEVQKCCAGLYPDGCTKAQAREILYRELPRITAAAQKVVDASGYDYKVGGRLVNMYFPTRIYGSATFPAGHYDALRLTIGSGRGHNWWCVMFPPMCISAANGGECDPEDVLDSGSAAIVTDSAVYKFKIYEVYEKISDAVGRGEK